MFSVVHAATQKAMFSNAGAATIAMAITLLGDLAAPVISANWLIDIRTVVSVGGIVLTATWWLSKKFQNIEDRLKNAEVARQQMQEALGEIIREHKARRH